MKRYVLLLVCAVLWAPLARAQDSGPNPRQSVVYYVDFVKESADQLSQAHELLAKEKNAENYPYTERFAFYTELGNRIDQATTLVLDLCDLYYIYHRATYCFAKEEKAYLLSRIDNIAGSLRDLADRPFVVATDSREGDKAKMQDDKAAFTVRMHKLLAFIPTTLPAIKRD